MCKLWSSWDEGAHKNIGPWLVSWAAESLDTGQTQWLANIINSIQLIQKKIVLELCCGFFHRCWDFKLWFDQLVGGKTWSLKQSRIFVYCRSALLEMDSKATVVGNQLLHVDVHIDQNEPCRGILELLSVLRPQWKAEDIQLKASDTWNS